MKQFFLGTAFGIGATALASGHVKFSLLNTIGALIAWALWNVSVLLRAKAKKEGNWKS